MKGRNLPAFVKAAFRGMAWFGVKVLTLSALLRNCHSTDRAFTRLRDAAQATLSGMRFAVRYHYSKLQFPEPVPGTSGGPGQR
jgi:hypothetical protein